MIAAVQLSAVMGAVSEWGCVPGKGGHTGSLVRDARAMAIPRRAAEVECDRGACDRCDQWG
ncbi:hypothetical protein Acsp05_29920 [Actinokineospora sp. NBRC 105648]|nr:hypothetical protein Acsp05_29920 [Actinokineospora sp. NBRC 105648]